MKAISLWQPWASLVVLGAKKIETRHWTTNYRGPLLIHAAKRKDYEEFSDLVRHWYVHGIDVWDILGIEKPVVLKHAVDSLPHGAIIGQVDLVDCKPVESFELSLSLQEHEFGNYADGRFGWILDNPKPFAVAVPYKGSQGFFEVDTSLF
jgi:hypothetical protein